MTVSTASSDHKNDKDNADSILDDKIYILGECYKNNPERSDHTNSVPYQRGFISNMFATQIIEDTPLQKNIESKPFFTYRTRFEPIQMAEGGPSPMMFQRFIRDNPLNSLENIINNPDCFTTDIGWGCMIRTGQSLLANALQTLLLGKHFTLQESKGDQNALSVRNNVLSWFFDRQVAPFSIQNFVKKGTKLSGMKPGEWFGPAATASAIRELIHDFPECGITDCVISISSGDISSTTIQNIYEDNDHAKILILLGVKLGLNDVNPQYGDEILKFMESEYSVGIAGGRPSSSFYFLGHEGPELLYFDPHTPQNMLDSSNLETCITNHYGRLNIADMDPSMMVGILILSEDDWNSFSKECSDIGIINILDDSVQEIPGDIEEFDICSMESGCSDESFHPVTSQIGNKKKDSYVNIQPIEDGFKSGMVYIDYPGSPMVNH